MAAPFPYESVAGVATDIAESEATNLYRHYAWLARLADEMDTAADLDLKRTMQIVFHSRQFSSCYDILQAHVGTTHTQAQIASLILATFALKKCVWATAALMNADLQLIYSNFNTAADWIEANQSDYKAGYSVNKEVSPGVMTDTPLTIVKTAAIATRISALRALFGVKG